MKKTSLAVTAAIVVTLCPLVAFSAADNPALRHIIAARQELLDHFLSVKASAGDTAYELVGRLNGDVDAVGQIAPPPGYSATDWIERERLVADLDSDLIADLIAGNDPRALQSPGIAEHVIRSKVDGTLQALALYVPPAHKISGIVVLLHGHQQSEAEILGAPYFRKLADSTGTIVVAPYGRGLYDFAAPGSDDVYQALDVVREQFTVDARHIFLVGYSMGGFSVFSLGLLHPGRWSAIMCISGAILNSETAATRFRFRATPFYIVTGKHDMSIPAVYGEETATFLNNAGVPTSFYEEPTGEHWLGTLLPSLTAAWRDMFAGIIREPTGLAANGALPNIPVAPSDRNFKP